MLKNLSIALFVMLTLSACSSNATMVRKDGVGGRVTLSGAYMPAMADAHALMVDHCQGRFSAVEHGEQVEFECYKPIASDNLLARADQTANGDSAQ